jgi:thiosulfate dehydrogenase
VGKFLAGLILGILLFPVIVVVYLMLGLAPASSTAPPMPFERYIAGTALRNRISREAPKQDAASFTTWDLVAGARVYRKNCAVCHGDFQRPAPAIASSMYPPAPQLLTKDGMVTDDPVGVTYWKVQNGIRLSGMPSFESILKDQEKWDVSALLARVNALPPEAQEALQAGQVSPASAPTPPSAKQ